MPQACANGIFAYRAISSVPMIAARMDATCDIHSVPNLLEGRVGIRSQMVEANNLVRVRDYDVSHREERRKTGNDLCADVRATLGNFEEFVQGCSLSYKLKNFLFFVFLTSYGLHTSEKQELLPIV